MCMCSCTGVMRGDGLCWGGGMWGRLHRWPLPLPPPLSYSQTEIMGELIAALETAVAPSTDMDR